MKKIAMVFSALLVTCAISGGTTTFASVRPTTFRMVDEKVKIKPEELPEAARTTLAGDSYKGWEVAAAYKDSETGAFEVELKKGQEAKTVKFDKDGKTTN